LGKERRHDTVILACFDPLDGLMDSVASPDPFDLNRFVKAQGLKFDAVLDELKRGEKRSHWMWFIFPQLRGLGMSSTAKFYGIASLEEAFHFANYLA
jgi:uncharacterized protein (DUF1810 family)